MLEFTHELGKNTTWLQLSWCDVTPGFFQRIYFTHNLKHLRFASGTRMQFTVRETHGIVVLTVSGEIEVYNTGPIQAEVKQLIAGKKTRIVLDMDSVPFIDSTGIGVILLWHKGLKDAGGGLKLIRITPSVEQVFQLTRLNKILEIHNTEAEAIAAFG